jgi:NADH dehydrogenase
VGRSSPAAAVPDAEFAAADVRRSETLTPVLMGAAVVVSAMHGMDPAAGESPASVDRDGNTNLIRASKDAGARLVLMSLIGATPDHPMELFRMKAEAERELRATSNDWRIVRASAFAELYADLLAQTAAKSGLPRIFGRGANPINFVSVHDVASAVAHAVNDPDLRGHVIDVGGPENLTMDQLAARVCGTTHAPGHIPRGALRMMSVVAMPFRPALARLAKQALMMDEIDLTFDPAPSLAAYPWLTSTRISGVSIA